MLANVDGSADKSAVPRSSCGEGLFARQIAIFPGATINPEYLDIGDLSEKFVIGYDTRQPRGRLSKRRSFRLPTVASLKSGLLCEWKVWEQAEYRGG